MSVSGVTSGTNVTGKVEENKPAEKTKSTVQCIFDNTVKNPNFWCGLFIAGGIVGIGVTVAVAPWIAPVVVPLLVAEIFISLCVLAAVNAPSRPAYVAPAPVYVAPRPVYVAPRPVYVAPRRPVYVPPPPIFIPVPVGRPHHHHHFGHHHPHHHHFHHRRW